MNAQAQRLVCAILESDDLDFVDSTLLDRYFDTFDAEDAEKVKNVIQDNVTDSPVDTSIFNGESLVGMYVTWHAGQDSDMGERVFSLLPIVRQHFASKYGLPWHELDVSFESKPYMKYVMKISSTRKAIRRHRPQ